MSKDVVKTQQGSPSTRYAGMIMKEFAGVVGNKVVFDEQKKRLSQHLFIKADAVLKELETKRIADGGSGTPYTWENINLAKMAIDSVHRIEIGLDALIDNHLFPIPYWNKKLNKFDLDLRIGYAGKDFYKRQMSYDQVIDIRYELVYKNDVLDIIKRDMNNPVEGYKFEIKKPFERGPIVGGFGYIVFKDETKNKLVIATEADFLKAEKLAKSKKFWAGHAAAMRFKTLVNITTKALMIDPGKMSESYFKVEQQEKIEAGEIEEERLVIDIQAETAAFAEITSHDQEKKQEKPVEKTPEQILNDQESEEMGPGGNVDFMNDDPII